MLIMLYLFYMWNSIEFLITMDFKMLLYDCIFIGAENNILLSKS